MYHVDLELDADQVRQLKQLAFDRKDTVRGLVTKLAKKEIQENKRESKKQKEGEQKK